MQNTEPESSSLVVTARRLLKRYGPQRRAALDGVDIELRRGEWVALLGRSGCGKSTLLSLLGGLDRASSGELQVAGHDLHRMTQSELDHWRGRHVGVVFQFFQLLPTLTALENVVLAMDFVGEVPAAERHPRASALLAALGLEELADRLPEQLSGGQQQRVAVARALANSPPLILADEPTGNLDEASAESVMRTLEQCAREGKTVLLVTHDEALASRADRALRMVDGRLVTTA